MGVTARAWRVVLVVALVAGVLATTAGDEPSAGGARMSSGGAAPSCDVPRAWLERIARGRYPGRSGDLSVLPATPAYMASGGGGWSHSGPWDYLQHVPLVFYGPGIVDGGRTVDSPVTLADVAPTLGELLGFEHDTPDGRVLSVARPAARAPKLVVTVVLDGGGWNTLRQWPDAFPTLARMARSGVNFTNAAVGSSPSVTPAVHTTLGTGVFPARHGVTGVVMRAGDRVVDSFLDGESSRFIRVPTFAERWDEAHGNRALIGMVAYEPWHLGMIGMGAERAGGDRDHAAWIDSVTNEWTTNLDHYGLPQSLVETPGLGRDLVDLDAADGRVDGRWRDNNFLSQPARIEQTPAFTEYHGRGLRRMIRTEGYGADEVTDLLFTNFKQMDILGHYFNMVADEVRDALQAADRELERTIEFLDHSVGRGKWVMIVTADHGQQPDASFVRGFGIEPREVEADLIDRFGSIDPVVWPTEVFLSRAALEERGYSLDDVADFLRTYRVRDNTSVQLIRRRGAGLFGPDDRVFALVDASPKGADSACE